jgi:hypothetical protein
MKRTLLIILAALLLCVPATATDQPMADKIVGFWISSSGTPIKIAYSGDAQKALLSINGGPDIDLWLNTSRHGDLVISYTAPDGTVMQGVHEPFNKAIRVESASGSFTATWQRR